MKNPVSINERVFNLYEKNFLTSLFNNYISEKEFSIISYTLPYKTIDLISFLESVRKTEIIYIESFDSDYKKNFLYSFTMFDTNHYFNLYFCFKSFEAQMLKDNISFEFFSFDKNEVYTFNNFTSFLDFILNINLFIH